MSSRAPQDGARDLTPAILAAVADGVTVLDRSGTVRYANDAAAKLMGFPGADALIGMPSAELMGHFDLLDEAGDPLDPTTLPTRLAFTGTDAPEAVVRFRTGDGAERWSIVRARLLPGASPDEDLVVSAFQDITTMKRSERRLAFLADAGALLASSKSYQATLGRVAELAVGYLADWCVVDVLEVDSNVQRVAVAHSDPGRLKLARSIQRRWPMDPNRPGGVTEVLRTGKAVIIPSIDDASIDEAARSSEHAALLRQLEIDSAVIVPLPARGRVLGAMTLIRSRGRPPADAEDVTVAHELARRAASAIDTARLLAEAGEGMRLRDEFMAVTSHDMRTPLAAMRGYAQLALRHLDRPDGPDPEALRRWIRDIDEGAVRLNEFVSELMDASLLRGGQDVPLQVGNVELRGLLGDLLDRSRAMHPDREFTLDGADEISGVWDASRLGRILGNLLDNAVKYSGEGSEVLIRLTRDVDTATIEIVDQGIGIAESDLPLIFEPAFRGRNALGLTGSGLGLAGSHRLIKQMGGRIEVESELGRGSTFRLRLPIAPAA